MTPLMGTSDSSRSPQCPVCNDALAFHTYETRKQAGIKTQCFVPACTEIYSLHWSFHLRIESASFVWVTLPQAGAEQRACRWAVDGNRRGREPPLLLYFIPEHRGTKVACSWGLVQRVTDLPLQKDDVGEHSPLRLLGLIHLCCLAFAFRSVFQAVNQRSHVGLMWWTCCCFKGRAFRKTLQERINGNEKNEQ